VRFRDAIGHAISRDEPYYEEDELDLGDEKKADAVLNMPEMQAIRGALRKMADNLRVTIDDEEIPWLLAHHGIAHDHVVEWVLGSE
jgi:hypothetical protein